MVSMKNTVSHMTINVDGKAPIDAIITKTVLFIYCFAYGNNRIPRPPTMPMLKRKQIVPTRTAATVGFLLISF